MIINSIGVVKEGFTTQIVVNTLQGATVMARNDDIILTQVASNGSVAFNISKAGKWIITGEYPGKDIYTEVVNVPDTYNVTATNLPKLRDMAVGSMVKIKIGGKLTDFRIIHKGMPHAGSGYSESCDGIWLEMQSKYKDIWAYTLEGESLPYAVNELVTEIDETLAEHLHAIKTPSSPRMSAILLGIEEYGYQNSGRLDYYATYDPQKLKRTSIDRNYWTFSKSGYKEHWSVDNWSGTFVKKEDTYLFYIFPVIVLDDYLHVNENAVVVI